MLLSAAQQSPNGPSEWGRWLLIYFGAAAFPHENDCIMLFYRAKVSVLKISHIRGAMFQWSQALLPSESSHWSGSHFISFLH